MNGNIYKTKESILSRAREAIGKSIKEIDTTNRLNIGKGAIGSVLEESWFGYSINSDAEPDFPEAGVELKVTPYKKTKNGLRAKERLVCNIINYMEEYKLTFRTSSFWKKCNTLLLMSYEHKENIPKGDFTIDEAILFSFPTEDLLIIEKDWETIIQKIRGGKAHEISEGDTLYLGACTKGATAASVRKQPFSNIPAKQRAFSLKQSYMSYILNAYIFGDKKDERVIKDVNVLSKQSFEEYIASTVQPHIGKTQHELIKEFGLESRANAKNINELILSGILGVKGKISNTEEFKKANIIPKTITVKVNNSIKESMSFSTFEFNKIINESWDECEFKNILEQTKFLFVIFKYSIKGELLFERIQFWNMPEEDLNQVQIVWERTVDILRSGVLLEKKGNTIKNNLPKQTDNKVAHVRPKSAKSAYRFGDISIGDLSDAYQLPDGRWMTKQCFWLNNSYVREQIEKR